MNFVGLFNMDFDSFKLNFNSSYDIYLHHFWLAACYWPGESCVSLQMTAVILSLQITD